MGNYFRNQKLLEDIDQSLEDLCTEFQENLNLDDLKILYESIMKRNPSGIVSKKDLVFSLQNIGSKELVDSLYFHLDTDKDGEITVIEYICGMIRFSYATPKKKIDIAFQIFDIDRNGVITKDEFKRCIKLLYQIHPKDKKIDIDKKTDEMFQELDEDDDKSISLDEFSKIVFKYEELTDILQNFISPHF